MDKQELGAIRARCEAATPGPWTYDGLSFINHEDMKIAEIRGYGYLSAFTNGLNLSPNEAVKIMDANAQFIAHARENIPALLDALKAKETVNQLHLVSADIQSDKFEEISADRDYWKARADEYVQKIDELTISCDGLQACMNDWKNRAEALERAIKSISIGIDPEPFHCAPCQVCLKHVPYEPPITPDKEAAHNICLKCLCNYFKRWEFDETRFMPESEAQDDQA